jgi:hypothetical protein
VEKERFWRDVLRNQGKSGLNVREFCRGEGLKESAFYFWKRTIAERDREKKGDGKSAKAKRRPKRGPQRKAPASPAATFVPLAVVGETPRLEIVAPDGWQVAVPGGVDIQTLSDVVAVLRQAVGGERV